MKNLVIAVIVIIAAFLVYQQFSSDSEPVTEPSIETNTSETAEAAQKITNNTLQSSLISPAAEGAEVFIISPKSGETVSSPFFVKFGIKNMAVAKAGENIAFSGHHHLLINLEEMPDMSQPLPATEQIIHFGGAQTEAEITLAPGTHSLRLLLGNYLHIPHDKPILSEEVVVIVE